MADQYLEIKLFQPAGGMHWKESFIKTHLELEPNMGQIAEKHCRKWRLLVFYILIC